MLQIEALPEIVKAVGDKIELYLDGGITEGTDVFKALALGAKMVSNGCVIEWKLKSLLEQVFMGRPAIWGLAYDGENGVKKVIETIKREFDFALALTGIFEECVLPITRTNHYFQVVLHRTTLRKTWQYKPATILIFEVDANVHIYKCSSDNQKNQ